jgi:hypothetical protein
MNVKAKKRHITGLYMLRRRWRLRATVLLGRSAYGLAPTQNLRHILSALEMLRIFLFGPPKRHIQPERYVPFGLKMVGNV